ncbi:hypothetical protein V6N11_065159 [Hibiscus sabdariffa]|uniref:Aspartic peptidase DDI1-type domain-containing protein n=1 Tax=Hibiscus sabdariffa TaxID=183260 RepID=A0ABR2QGJ2_9ROSI
MQQTSATHKQCKAITTRSGRNLQPSNKRKQGEKTVDNPNAAIVSDELATGEAPASVDKDHDIPPPQKETEPAATNPEPKLSRIDTLEDIRQPPPFPQSLKKQKHEYQFKKFFDILKHVHINLPLVEALQQMPNYVKFLKDIVSRKSRIGEFETTAATKACLVTMHNKVPAKRTDPGSFTIPCSIGNHYVGKALCDPGANINLMPKSLFQKLGIGEERPTTVMLQLADRSYIQSEGKIEYILLESTNLFSTPTS